MSKINIEQKSFSDAEVQQFLAANEEDILIYHPDFELESAEMSNFLVLYSDKSVVGIFIYHAKGDQMHVEVDYILPSHRDQGIGIFFYGSKIDDFKKNGFSSVFAIASHPLYQEYLSEIGFKPVTNQSQLYQYELR